jgi:hypothetical protein
MFSPGNFCEGRGDARAETDISFWLEGRTRVFIWSFTIHRCGACVTEYLCLLGAHSFSFCFDGRTPGFYLELRYPPLCLWNRACLPSAQYFTFTETSSLSHVVPSCQLHLQFLQKYFPQPNACLFYSSSRCKSFIDFSILE